MSEATLPSSAPSPARKLAAWGVHFYTASQLPVALLGAAALHWGDGRLFFLTMWVTTLIDSSDGVMARAVKVREVTPDFNGRKLDDIIDFITFAFLPAASLPALGILPENLAWVAAIPLMASGYGFCQEAAKTEESFVGFPSYWNVLALYLYIGKPPVWFTVLSIVVLSVLVFVPFHYVYPTKAKLWKKWTLGLGIVWAVFMLMPMCLEPDAAWARPVMWVSLFYPVYYFVVSGVHHVRNAATEHAVAD